MRSHADFKTLVLLAVAVAGVASRSDAAIIPVPPGLDPGDSYRLVFVTSAMRDATSSDISVYNGFVSGVATSNPDLSALGATWHAIGSTATVNAVDNIGSSLPGVGIYRLDGAKVADGTADLFDGFISFPINLTESGGAALALVWTGSGVSGDGAYVLGGGAGGQVTRGGTGDIDSSWIHTSTSSSTGLRPFYAISSEITVGGGAAVPEPASIGLTALGGAILLFAVRRKRKDPLA